MPTITTNTSANTALRYLNINSEEQNDNLAKIASGSRITRASDDAAGLAIGTALQTDVATLKQASINTSHGVSVLSAADGGMSSINDILQRMKVLATQAVSGTNSATELGFIQSELDALTNEVTAIATATSFNGQSLLDGTSVYATGVDFMAGTSATDTLNVTIAAADSDALGLSTAGVSNLDVVTDAASRSATLAAIDTAIDSLSAARASTGAQMSRFEYRGAMLATSTENIDAAQSAIMDTDVAAEQAELSSNEVKTDAAIAALSQANELPKKLLDLLR